MNEGGYLLGGAGDPQTASSTKSPPLTQTMTSPQMHRWSSHLAFYYLYIVNHLLCWLTFGVNLSTSGINYNPSSWHTYEGFSLVGLLEVEDLP